MPAFHLNPDFSLSSTFLEFLFSYIFEVFLFTNDVGDSHSVAWHTLI